MSPGNVRRHREIKKADKVAEKKRKKAERKAKRTATGKKQTINTEQFEKLVSELMGQGKIQEQAIKMISQKYEIR